MKKMYYMTLRERPTGRVFNRYYENYYEWCADLTHFAENVVYEVIDYTSYETSAY